MITKYSIKEQPSKSRSIDGLQAWGEVSIVGKMITYNQN
jgi:hypothetical protein